MKGYCRNSISVGENREKMEDQSVIKGKLKNQKAKYLKRSLILRRAHTGRRREGGEQEKRRRRGRGRISQERYEFLYTSMDVLILYGNY